MSIAATGIEPGGVVGAGVGDGVGDRRRAPRLADGFADGFAVGFADGVELGVARSTATAAGGGAPRLAGATPTRSASGLGLAGASAGATRTRWAWVASQLTSLNGPVPTGASLNGSWASAARRHVVEQVVGQERLGRRVQEAADRRGQVEADGLRVDRR